jgi:hypothetical protein
MWRWADTSVVFQSLKGVLTLVLSAVIQQVHPGGPGVGQGQKQQRAQQHLHKRKNSDILICDDS